MRILIVILIFSLFCLPLSAQINMIYGKGKYFTIKFDVPTQIKTITILESGDNIYCYEIEHHKNYRWHRLDTGDTIGYRRVHQIEPIWVVRVRLRVVRAKNIPIIKAIIIE